MKNKLNVKKAAILGAGVMGAQIAAHFANANIPVVLFDLPSEGKDKNAIIKGAMKNSIEKLYRNVPELSVMKNEDKLAKFTQWLMADGNTPFLKQFVKIKRLQNTPSIKDLKRSIISAVNLLGTNQKINGLVFETIKELLQYGD